MWTQTRRRDYARCPDISALEAKKYIEQWRIWWKGLQPEWRRGAGILPPAIYDCANSDWGKLRQGGKNGVFLVLMSLVWWGLSPGKKRDWDATVIEVKLVLESMAQRTNSRKRPSSDLDLAADKRPRRLGIV